MTRCAAPAQAAFDWRRLGLVAGVDEAGRGPLAGPVFAAAVILDPAAADRRTRRFQGALAGAARGAGALRSARTAGLGTRLGRRRRDRCLNILQATLLAMRRALAGARYRAGALGGWQPLPGRCRPRLRVHRRGRGPGRRAVPAISAASILAKYARDELMRGSRPTIRDTGCHPQGVPYGRPPRGTAATRALAAAPPQLCPGTIMPFPLTAPNLADAAFRSPHVHTEYSLVDSVVRARAACARG